MMLYDYFVCVEFQMGKLDEGVMMVYLNNMILVCLVVKFLVILLLFVLIVYLQVCGLCYVSRGIVNCLDQGVFLSFCIRILNFDGGCVGEVFVLWCS